MQVGDLVRHQGSVARTGMCATGIIIKNEWEMWCDGFMGSWRGLLFTS